MAANRPEHRRIVTALLTVGLFVAMAKVVGAAKETIVAARFGAGPVADAYAFLLSLASWPAGAWVSAVSAILVPLIVRLDLEQPEDASRLFRREAVGLTLWVAAVVGVVLFGAMRLGLNAGVFGLSAPVAEAAAHMVALMAACAPLMMVVGVLAAFLMGGMQHTNSLLEALTPLVIGIVVLVAAGAPAWSLPLGTVAGYAVQAIVSATLQPRKAGFPLPAFTMTSPAWKLFWSGFWLLLVSQLILSVSSVVDQIMVVRLGPSANAILAYSNRLTALVIALGATVIARATLPVFSEARFKQPGQEWVIALRWVQLLFALGLAAAALGWIVAPLMVRVLLQHGAFTAANSALVAKLFRFSLLQLPFYFSAIVLAQLVASAGRYTLFMYGNVINIAVKIGLNVLLIPRFGLLGALLGTAGMQVASVTFLWWVSARRYARLSGTT